MNYEHRSLSSNLKIHGLILILSLKPSLSPFLPPQKLKTTTACSQVSASTLSKNHSLLKRGQFI